MFEIKSTERVGDAGNNAVSKPWTVCLTKPAYHHQKKPQANLDNCLVKDVYNEILYNVQMGIFEYVWALHYSGHILT